MKWFRITKELSPKPTSGKLYSDWKENLAQEGKHQCVYCTISENEFGGIRNFHVEHYRPKAEDKFPELKHEYNNLFFSCSICNCFKGDDWPNEPSAEYNKYFFPDPSKIDYSSFLEIDNEYMVVSKFITGKYIIEKLYLNRPQLVLARKVHYFSEELKKEYEILKNIILKVKEKNGTSDLILDGFLKIIDDTIFFINGKNSIPYTLSQIKK